MGWMADRSGPRAIVFAGGILLGLGYFGLYYSYLNTDPHQVFLPILAFWSFCTGLGSCAGMTAGLNAVAKSFAAETVSRSVQPLRPHIPARIPPSPTANSLTGIVI